MGGSCFFIWRVPPCGAGRGCDFLSDQKVTKESPGPPSMSAYAERALIGGLPRAPFAGDALLEDRHLRPAGKIRTG